MQKYNMGMLNIVQSLELDRAAYVRGEYDIQSMNWSRRHAYARLDEAKGTVRNALRMAWYSW